MFNDLNNFLQQSAQQEFQNTLIKAQLRAKEAEKALVREKYQNKYPSVFDKMNQALHNATMDYVNKFDETIKSKRGYTQELSQQVWKDGMGIDYTKYSNDTSSYKGKIDIDKMKITACTTLAEADLAFSKAEDEYNQFFSNWKIKTAESTQRWTAHFDKLVIKANTPVNPVPQENNPVNPVPQENNDLLQELQVLKQQLAQKASIINSLVQGMQIAQSSLEQANVIINDQKIIINDQKITINDCREDKIMLKEKVNEQKIKINTLTDANLEQVEKIHKISDKYLDLKTHFVDLVTLHQEDDPGYAPAIDLAGLSLN